MKALQPLQSPSSAKQNSVERSGKGTVVIREEKSREESKPSVELGLGIGTNCSARNPRSSGSGQSRKTTELGFTRAQLSEQTLVSKFIAAHLPLQLAFPILEGYCSSLGIKDEALGSESIMDPELNRCRRTDGKKWRCRKTVIPNQKYCESHMHRGRQRSRKPVELPNKQITVSEKSRVSNEIPLGLPFLTGNSDCSKIAIDGCSGESKSIPVATVALPTLLNFNSSKNKGFVSSVEEKPKAQRSSIVGQIGMKRDAMAMLGCSPTSVLQVGVNHDQWRCKRTDGKRWRCNRDALPAQNYCERHKHRVVTKLPAVVAVNSSDLNTNLSMSVTLGKAKSCSSSDTTLTDSAVAAGREDCSDASS